MHLGGIRPMLILGVCRQSDVSPIHALRSGLKFVNFRESLLDAMETLA
jgi:hypothetical protein